MVAYEFEYILPTPMEVTRGGDIESTNKLILYAPNFKQRKYGTYLEEVMTKVSLELSKEFAGQEQKSTKDDSPDDGKKVDGQAMIKAVMMSSTYKTEDVFVEFDKLLLSGACVFDFGDEKLPLKQLHLEKIPLDVHRDIFAKYIENFTMPSLLG